MKINAIQCSDCKDIIYSRATHDFHWCSCKGVFIDGGFDYIRCGGKDLEKIKNIELDLEVTKKELFDDWNKRLDKYGRISYTDYNNVIEVKSEWKSLGEKLRKVRKEKSKAKKRGKK